jgi:uncharacterized protein
MRKVVIDTNVFISAILFGGTPRKIINAWLEKKFILCLSPELKAEILIKLQKKFLLSSESIQYIEDALDKSSQKYIPSSKITICTDPKDNFLLELAEESNSNFLVSGDKHVLSLKYYKKTKILSPKDFVETARKIKSS